MKTSAFKIAVICSGIMILSYSCKKDDDNTDNGSAKNEVITNAGDITVKGSSNYEFEIELQGAYDITFKEKAMGNLENVQIYIEILGGWIDWMPGSIMALRTNDWYEGSWTQSYSKKAMYKFKVAASGAFEVTFQKLPLSQDAVSLPQNFSGAGGTFFGPLSISGNATFTINCSDAIAGFTVILLDATTGIAILNPDHTHLYTNLDANYNIIYNINTTVTLSDLSGTYLILVLANMNADYTVSVQ
jgi:hypothetical protein